MDKPVAIEKAEALARHLYCAPDIATTTLLLTDREAWQFLDWYRTQLEDRVFFDSEMRQAKALKDPWPMMNGITVLGFYIERAHHEESH